MSKNQRTSISRKDEGSTILFLAVGKASQASKFLHLSQMAQIHPALSWHWHRYIQNPLSERCCHLSSCQCWENHSRYSEGGWLEFWNSFHYFFLQASIFWHIWRSSALQGWTLATDYHIWYVRLSFLKYNYRMAQPTKWVAAILNYMKEVRLNKAMSLPLLRQSG